MTELLSRAGLLVGGQMVPHPSPIGYRLAWFTAAAWGVAELALRMRLVLRPGLRERLRDWAALTAERLRERTFIIVVPVMAVAVVAAMWLVRFRWVATGGGTAVAAAGEVLAVAGIGLRIWAIVTLDQLFTFAVSIAEDHLVVQHGPYRVLRHPGYAGVLLTLIGIGITLENWLSIAVIFVLPALALGIRIQVEERTLADALGEEYRRYAGRTARLIPGVW